VRALLERSFAAFQRRDPGAGRLWLSFVKHLDFLKANGFVDERDRLTPDGRWASRLRLDQPLLIAEAIRRGALEGAPPEIVAAGLAPFVWDREQEPQLWTEDMPDMGQVEAIFLGTMEAIREIRVLKAKWGFAVPPVAFWPAAAMFQWAKGASWERLLRFVRADEGDLASLIMRTADHLRQIAGLKDTHPRLAAAAASAIELILREPVYVE
jgi:superfamily II RNA helicase